MAGDKLFDSEPQRHPGQIELTSGRPFSGTFEREFVQRRSRRFRRTFQLGMIRFGLIADTT